MHSRFYHSIRTIGALLLMQSLLINSCLAQSQDNKGESVDGYRTIEWIDLMPKEDLDALLNPPDILGDIIDGSEEDQISSNIQSAIEQAVDSDYKRALVSARVVPAFDGQAIRLPGFVVPLEFGDGQQRVIRFFLVPYFGACIHMPPPPPNQILYAEYDKGMTQESLYDPVWISGVLSTSLIENETATAAYTIKVDRLEPYTD